MLAAYMRLWRWSGSLPPSRLILPLLLGLSIVLPITLSMVFYQPLLTLAALAVIGGLVGTALFYDVRRFLFLLFPFVFLTGLANVGLALALLILVSFLAGMIRADRMWVEISYPVMFLVLGVSLFMGWSQANDKSLARYLIQHSYLVPILIFIVINNLNPDVKLIRANLFVVSVIGAIIGLGTLAMYLRTGVPRIIFQWDSQNLGAAFLGLTLPFPVLALLEAKQAIQRSFWVAIILAIGAGIAVSQTRAILLGSLLAIIYIGWRDRRALKIMLPILLVAAVMAPALIFSRLLMLIGRGPNADWSTVGRIQVWLNSLQLLPHYFLRGMGISNFHGIYMASFPYSFLPAQHPHNLILHYIFEIGVFGMIAYMTIIISCLARGHRAVRLSPVGEEEDATRVLIALNAGVMMLLIAGMADAYLRDPRVSILFWSYLAFQLVLVRQIKPGYQRTSSSSDSAGTPPVQF
jgi:O-antigen ligase